MIRRVLVFVTLCLPAGSSFAQEAKFDLTKQPKFRPGDTVRIISTKDSRRETIAGGKTVENAKETLRATEVDEVLAVDEAGMPTEIRVTLESAVLEETVTWQGGSPDTKKTTLRDLALTRKKAGVLYRWDTTSILAKEPNALTAPQVWLLKDLQGRPSQWDPDPRKDAVLMSKAPASVGTEWEPSAEALEKWIKDHASVGALSGKVRSARFRLSSAAGQVAAVDGNMAFAGSRNGMEIEIALAPRCQIDTQSGRWTQSDVTMRLTGKREGLVTKAEIAAKTSMQYPAGPGSPPGGPAWANKVGWSKPPPDTNSFKDKDRGVSLDVPKGYTPVEVKDPGAVIARFRSPQTRTVLTITCDLLPVLVDLEEMTAATIESVKKGLDGYQVAQKTRLSLPNNVPAVLVTGKALEGKWNVVMFLAMDGKKALSASVSSPSDSGDDVEALTKIAQTLRSFDEEE